MRCKVIDIGKEDIYFQTKNKFIGKYVETDDYPRQGVFDRIDIVMDNEEYYFNEIKLEIINSKIVQINLYDLLSDLENISCGDNCNIAVDKLITKLEIKFDIKKNE